MSSGLADQGWFSAQPDYYVGNTCCSASYLDSSIASIAPIGLTVSSFSDFANSSMTSTPSSSENSGISSVGGGGLLVSPS